MTFPQPLLRVAALAQERLTPLAAPRTVELLDRMVELEETLEASAAELGGALFEAAGPPDPEAGVEAARARLAVVALRRAVFNRRPLSASDLTPAGSRLGPELGSQLEDWIARQQEIRTTRRRFITTFQAELSESREALLAAAFEPEFQAAIRLVSRSLLASLRSLGDPSRWRHDERLVATRLVAYLGRAATKTSPNGLFCATALAGWARDPLEAGFEGENRLRLDVLLNVTEARKIASCLGAEPASWPALVPRINPTLREDDRGWTFWRPASLRREDDDEIRRRLDRQPVAEILLRHAASQELSVPQLLEEVGRETGLATEDLARFYQRLADLGLLSEEIEIPYTCRRPLAFLSKTVRRAGGRPDWLTEVEAVEDRVKRLPYLTPIDRVAAMDEVTERLGALPHTRQLVRDELFRVDAASALRVELPASLLGEISSTVSRYARLFASLYPRSVLCRNLARPLLRHYEPDQEVSLLELYHRLDIRDRTEQRPAAFPEPSASSEGAGTQYERVRSFFVERAREAAAADEDEVALEEEDWLALVGAEPEPSWEAGVLFQIAARDARALAGGRYQLVLNDLFTGVGVALARFAHLHTPDDRAALNPILNELKRSLDRFIPPGTLPAEVTFNHWGRAANAGLRIPFLEHEIELLGEKASPGATVIPLAELTLRWASDEERLVLRWPRRDVEVVPVLSSGVATEGFISLLAGIGRQSIQPLSLFPGFEAEGVKCWPRFVHGRVVIFRQRWIFPPTKAPEPVETGKPDRRLAEFFTRVSRWRRREGLPRHLFVSSSRERKPFYVDLCSPLFVGLLQRLLIPPPGESPPTLYAAEMLPGSEETWVRDSAGRYAAEFLVQIGSG